MEEQLIEYQKRDSGNLRDFLNVCFKRKKRIVVIFCSVIFAVAVASLVSPKVYEARSTLLIKYGREYMYRPEVGGNEAIRTLKDGEILNSGIQILTSRDLIKKVIETITVETMYPGLANSHGRDVKPVDAAIETFSRNLKAEGIKNSNVIEVTFRHGDPRVAATAVNMLVDFYKEKHLQVFSNPQSSYLEGQVSSLRKKLSEAENKMQSFKQKNRVYSLDEQRTMSLRQKTDTYTDLLNTQNRISELRRKVAYLKTQKSLLEKSDNFYTPTENDKILVEAKSKLLSLQINEQEMLRKYTEKNKMVVDVRKEIQLVRDFIKEEEKKIHSKLFTGNPIYQEAQKSLVASEAELGAQNAKLATLHGQLRKLDDEVRGLDLSEKEMMNIKRELTANEKSLQIYDEKMEEARIIDELNRLKLANISVIEAAAIPIKPVAPNTMQNIALGIIFGALSSIGLAFLAELNTQVFTTPESVEKRLNLAVIACIPYKE